MMKGLGYSLGLVVVALTPLTSSANSQIINQSGTDQRAAVLYTNTIDNETTVTQGGQNQEADVEIVQGSLNAVIIDQAPLGFHDVRLLIRNGNENLVNVNQAGVDNNAGELGGSRMRIRNGDNNSVDIDQNAISGVNEIDMDILEGSDNTVLISQQLVSLANDTDVRIENSNGNTVSVFQSLVSGFNSTDIDLRDGGDNEVLVVQTLSGLSSATVDIAGGDATATITQVDCLGCDSTILQLSP